MNQPSFSPISTRLRETGTVLDSIVAQRRTRLPELHEAYGHIDPLTLPRSTRSFEDALRTRRYDDKEGFQPRPSGPAIIMECKSASPTLGTIIEGAYSPRLLARAYSRYAAAISVLTEPDRFNGNFADLDEVRDEVNQPVLCKDFIIDPIQITAARSHGADAILLMLSVLDDQDYTELSLAAHRLGMDVLTEVDSEEDMHRAQHLGARIIGINNRDLRTLQIDITRTQKLAPLAPKGAVIVGESGVHSRDDVMTLAPYVDALLVAPRSPDRMILRRQLGRSQEASPVPAMPSSKKLRSTPRGGPTPVNASAQRRRVRTTKKRPSAQRSFPPTSDNSADNTSLSF